MNMSIWGALVFFVLFPGPHLRLNEAAFWFMMQIGMIVGFFTSYPVNIFLVKSGWKEKMPQYKYEIEKHMREERSQNQKTA